MDAAIYVRISQDREGAGLGVARQEAECRALADRKRWAVTAVYSDNDTSAYTGKPRKQWNRLLADIKAGTVQAVICWHVDRLTRTPRELEDVIDLADKHNTALATVTGDIDLATSTGRMVARMLGAAARHESEHKGERAKSQMAEVREAGRFTGGPRPFGFERDGMTLRPQEADWLKWAYEQKVQGVGNMTVIRALDAAGVKTSGGNGWSTTALKRTLRNPRYAGLVNVDGVLKPAAWPAVVSRETWEHASRTLSARDNPAHHPGRKFFIAGKVFCGREECGGPLVTGKATDRRHVMWCRPSAPYYGCGKISVSMQPLLAIVEQYLLAKLENKQLLRDLATRQAEADTQAKEILARIDSDTRRLRLLEAALDDGNEDELPEVVASIRRMRDRINRGRQSLSRRAGTTALDGIDPDTIVDDWHHDDFGVDRKYALLHLFVDRIIVYPAHKEGFVRFDPGRVDIAPRS